MAIWPATVPQWSFTDNPAGSLPNPLVRETMDAGPDIVRRRYTGAVEPISLSLRLTLQQWDVFAAWYQADLGDGALPFTRFWPAPPRTPQTMTMRFTASPQYQHRGAGVVDVDLELEILP